MAGVMACGEPSCSEPEEAVCGEAGGLSSEEDKNISQR